jgi:hypothetical protein
LADGIPSIAATPGYEDEVTARTVRYGVLQHEGAEKSAHETIEAEQEKWSSLAQLAAEYETIAQAAQRQRFATAVAATGLDTDHAAAVVDGKSFGSLVAQLRRTEAGGHPPEQFLSRAVLAPSAVMPALELIAASHQELLRPARSRAHVGGPGQGSSPP